MPSVEQRRRRRGYSISNGATFWAERKAQTRATVVAAEAMANPSPGVAHASATLTGASPIRSIHRKFPVRRSACDARGSRGRVTPTRRRLPVDLRAIPAGRAVICARCDLTPALATGIHELVDVCPPPNSLRRSAGARGGEAGSTLTSVSGMLLPALSTIPAGGPVLTNSKNGSCV